MAKFKKGWMCQVVFSANDPVNAYTEANKGKIVVLKECVADNPFGHAHWETEPPLLDPTKGMHFGGSGVLTGKRPVAVCEPHLRLIKGDDQDGIDDANELDKPLIKEKEEEHA